MSRGRNTDDEAPRTTPDWVKVPITQQTGGMAPLYATRYWRFTGRHMIWCKEGTCNCGCGRPIEIIAGMVYTATEDDDGEFAGRASFYETQTAYLAKSRRDAETLFAAHSPRYAGEPVGAVTRYIGQQGDGNFYENVVRRAENPQLAMMHVMASDPMTVTELEMLSGARGGGGLRERDQDLATSHLMRQNIAKMRANPY